MKRTAKKLTLYEKVYAYSTTWMEMAIESHPLISAVSSAVILWALFL